MYNLGNSEEIQEIQEDFPIHTEYLKDLLKTEKKLLKVKQ